VRKIWVSKSHPKSIILRSKGNRTLIVAFLIFLKWPSAFPEGHASAKKGISGSYETNVFHHIASDL
jgi:hypothetical protein